MSRRGAPSGLAWQVGDVYTLHLWPPFGMPDVQQSGHYTGWALEGARRAGFGTGSPITLSAAGPG